MLKKMTNNIIHGDALLTLKSFNNDSIQLVYLDSPFSTGRDFLTKTGELAYSDKLSLTELLDSLIPIYSEIKRVLKPTGLFYCHTDYRFSHYVKIELDKIFGIDNFRNEIIWSYNSAPRKKKDFGFRHDTIFRYSKTEDYLFNEVREPYALSAPRGYEKEKYYHADGKVIGDVWQIGILGQNDKTERTGYPTQKPEKLLENIVLSSSNEGDLVLDPMCGSGTTLATAKRLNRQWLGIDSSEVAVKYSKERLG
jgi:DNA modification methylase